jgi:hypothetical protein
MLLQDLRTLFVDRGEDVLATKTILAFLLTLEERPWADYRHGKPLSAETLATLLRPFGVHSQKRRLDGERNSVACYLLADLQDTFTRWVLTANPEHPEQTCKTAVFAAEQQLTATRNNPEHGTGDMDSADCASASGGLRAPLRDDVLALPEPNVVEI